AALAADDARFARVQRVWRRLILANADLCPETTRDAGFTLHSLNSYPVEMREAAVRRFAIDARPAAAFLAPDSAAAQAGLRDGDAIVSVNGQSVRQARLNRRTRERDRAVADAAEKLGEALEGDAPITLEIARDGETRTIAFTPEQACASRLILARDDRVNAAANGRAVAITTGMARYLETDAELAVVLGHELAHNTLAHRDRQRDTTRPGRWGGTAAGLILGAATGVFIDFGAMAARGSQDMRLTFEREADYVGLYYAARAGFDTAGVETFWRRFAADYPASTYLTRSHPTAGERFLAIAAAQDEIDAKRAANVPLAPNPSAESQP
ncbi:MAG: M48 family metalloprotease, partial [Alphaproteobacteria bacterium]|nr:M48 family metalloprotease [Alphaproteobacteria bacterium]